jgi:L-threonylcarbamoyladenylate synthase
VTVTQDVDVVVGVLRHGGLAVLPTETVYGLGADATQPRAVARVYAAKGRPADHPLIVHLASVDEVPRWARDVPPYAWRLAEASWPGPLTLVLQRGGLAGHHVTGGHETVGLRVPDHPLTREVLRRLGGGVAAPSANRFGRVSPTSVSHVLDELGGVLRADRDVVLDGGRCDVGVESTILDCTGPAPVILRPGAVSEEQVGEIGGVRVDSRPSTVRAPGVLASHYAPRAVVRVIPAASLDSIAGRELAGRQEATVGVLAPAGCSTPSGAVRLADPQDVEDYAAVLYAALREADALGLTVVLAVPPTGPGLAVAVRDRLTMAAAGAVAGPDAAGPP